MYTHSNLLTISQNRKCGKIYRSIESLSESIDYFKAVKAEFDNADAIQRNAMRNQMLAIYQAWETDQSESLTDYVYLCSLEW